MTKFRLPVSLNAACFLTACVLMACATTPDATQAKSEKITRAEAKRLACPSRIVEVGASPEDCTCVENRLFDIGQKPGAIKYDSISALGGVGQEQGKRDVAIGILRLEAYEDCGLFDPEHAVSKNLHPPGT